MGLRRNPDFLKLWSAETVSVFGSLVSGVAMSFTAILWVRATPVQLSLLRIADLLPKFLVGLAAGVWVDRLRRRPLMVGADLGRALLLASIPAAAFFGMLRIEQLYVVTLLTGLLTLFFDVANRSYLPTLVPREELVEANSKLTASTSAAECGAFSLGGWLVQWLSGPVAVLIDAVSFLFSALFLAAIRAPEPAPKPTLERSGMRGELLEGLATVRGEPRLLALTGTTALLGLSGGVLGPVIVAFMVRDLGFHPGILGMIFAIGGVTSLLGSLAAGPLARRLGTGRALTAGLLFAAAGVLPIPLAHGRTLLAGALLVLNQVLTDPGHTVYDITAVSLRQSITPDAVQGRVNATMHFLQLGATLLGSLAGGLLGEWIGLRATLFVGAGAGLTAAACAWLSPLHREGM